MYCIVASIVLWGITLYRTFFSNDCLAPRSPPVSSRVLLGRPALAARSTHGRPRSTFASPVLASCPSRGPRSPVARSYSPVARFAIAAGSAIARLSPAFAGPSLNGLLTRGSTSLADPKIRSIVAQTVCSSSSLPTFVVTCLATASNAHLILLIPEGQAFPATPLNCSNL